jgi:hypothetical protein
MDGCGPQTATNPRPHAAQRPQTAPASRTAGRSLESQRVKFCDGPSVVVPAIQETHNPDFWALPEQDQSSNSRAPVVAVISHSSDARGIEKSSFTETSTANIPVAERKVSFKGLHIEKAAIDDYRGQQRAMALKCVTSLDGWEETKNSLIASIQNITSPDVALTEKARKTVLNSVLSNFFAVLHIPSFSPEYLDLENELHLKVPSYLMQLQTDIKNRQGSETIVDLKERETKRGILGTFGKQFMIESFISGVSLGRDDEESNLVVRRAELNEEFRKVLAMRKELESSNAALTNQRSKLDDLVAQLKTKDQRIDELEKLARRRDDSYADQISNLLKEIHALKTNFSKATSVAQATTYGIQTALLASTKQYQHASPPPIGNLVVESAKIQLFDAEQKKLAQAEHSKTLAAHEKRIRVLEDALCGAQAANLSDSQCHRHSLAAMINWASSTVKFEEDLFAVVEKIFRTDSIGGNPTLAISGKQLAQPQSHEKLSSILALTQEMSKVSIEISKMSTQKLSRFCKLLQFSNDLLSFIDHSEVRLPSDLECQRQDLFRNDPCFGNDDVIMFPEGHKVEKLLSSEDAELKRILGKQRTGFRDSLLDLLLQLHQKGSESQKNVKTKNETKNSSKTIHEADADRNAQRRDAHGSPKVEAATCKLKATAMMHGLLSAAVLPHSTQPVVLHTNVDHLKSLASAVQPDSESVSSLTRQRDEYMERLGVLSAEMNQLQITLKDIQKQRAEMSTKEDSDEMLMTIIDLKKSRDALHVQTKEKFEATTKTIFELTQERDMLRDELLRKHVDVLSADSKHSYTKDASQPQDDQIDTPSLIEMKPFKNMSSTSAPHCREIDNGQKECAKAPDLLLPTAIKNEMADACCQTINDWLPTKVTQMDIKHSPELVEDFSATNQGQQLIEQQIVNNTRQGAQVQTAMKFYSSGSHHLSENQIEMNGSSVAAAAARKIFDSTYRNLQSNILQQRVTSAFDEFDEGVRTDSQSTFQVPKIDLSKAFLQSVGETQVSHFQQNGSYLPRFQKVAVKSKIEHKVGFTMPSHPELTKDEKRTMGAIAPIVVSSSIMQSKKVRPTVSVLEIPNRFEIPASHFSQPPYTSRPSTSNHLGLFIGADIRPETARAPNSSSIPTPQRPLSARSADTRPSKRGAHVSRGGHLVHRSRVMPSPTRQCDVPNGTPQATASLQSADVLHVDEAPGIGMHSFILNQYLNDISTGQP